jgi:hypothetical protein
MIAENFSIAEQAEELAAFDADDMPTWAPLKPGCHPARPPPSGQEPELNDTVQEEAPNDHRMNNRARRTQR